jgi:hypothetical protein
MFEFEIEKKIAENNIDRDNVKKSLELTIKNMSLHDLVFSLTNPVKEIADYYQLFNNKDVCKTMSLLFNPHRLDTRTYSSKRSIYEALKTDSYIDGLSRVISLQARTSKKNDNLFYNSIGWGINAIGYVNEFPPLVARNLAIRYSLNKNSKILDPCSGWGGRLIGFSTVVNHYYGFDPSTKTYDGLTKLGEFISCLQPSFISTIQKLPFEDSELENDSFDFAMTSPPYYDTEIYSDEETNSLIRYKSFDDWCDKFYCPLILKTMNALKKDCFFILNIGNRRYPLSKVLLDNFSSTYDIKKIDNYLCNGGGLRSSLEDGEVFYQIRK